MKYIYWAWLGFVGRRRLGFTYKGGQRPEQEELGLTVRVERSG